MARPRGTKWQADITVNKQRYRVDGFDTQEEAEAHEAAIRAALRVGKPLPQAEAKTSRTGGMLLKEAFRIRWERTWQGSRSAETHRMNADLVLEYFGPDCAVDTIDEDAIHGFVTWMRTGGNGTRRPSSPGTINRKLSTLSMILKAASRRGALVRIPEFDREEEDEDARHGELSAETEQVVLATFARWGMPEMVDVVVVLVDTGLRVNELLRIGNDPVPYINTSKRTITVPGHISKNRKTRVVPMTERVQAVYRRRLETNKQPFAGLDKSTIRYRWDRMRGHLGFTNDPTFVPHMLRHTCASRLVQAGVDLYVVKEWLGHLSVQTTMRYARLSPKNLMDAAAVLNRLHSGEPAALPEGKPGLIAVK